MSHPSRPTGPQPGDPPATLSWRDALSAVVDDVYAAGCACAWPRLRYLLTWHFSACGHQPAVCVEGAALQDLVFDLPGAWERVGRPPDTGVERIRCTRCGSVVRRWWEEYSIAFSQPFAAWETLCAQPIGAALQLPVPLHHGFAGHIKDFSPFEKDHVRASVETMSAWLRA